MQIATGMGVGWAVLASLLWCVTYLRAARSLFLLRDLREVSPPRPEPLPTLSVVIPACNEAGTLRAALQTLLAQDYPNLELILIDDRSTDGTAELVDELAAAEARIVAVHVTELPEGWLGKVHALARGLERAQGEWVLFTDADVHFAPGVLKKAVALAVDRQLDHLPLVPKLRAESFWNEVAVNGFGLMFFTSVKAERLASRKANAYVGSGAFNLVRRAAFEQTSGFPWLRLEVADDMGLGLAMHRAGATAELWLATRDLHVLWYPSLRAMARGLEKNLFAVVGHFSYPFFVLRLGAMLALFAGPFVGPFIDPRLGVLTLLVLLSPVVLAVSLQRRFGQRFVPALFTPVGVLLIFYMLARSAYRTLRQRGIEWRGTRYPLAELRRMQRVKL